MNITAIFPPASFLRSQWSFLLFGFLLAFFSSPGQTIFISLFSQLIRDELALSHGGFGAIYAIGTLASAVCLIFVGRLVDVLRLRTIALIVVIVLGAAAFHFSTIASVATLAIGIFFLRITGQGMMTHLYATAISRRYIKERGRALAVASLGQPASEFVMPVFVLAMLMFMDWRGVWVVTALLAWAVMIPASLFATRRRKGQDGEGLEGVAAAGRGGRHWSRREMLLHWRFWMLCGMVIAPSFTATGLLFHQVHFASVKAIPLAAWVGGYGFFAAANITGALIGGGLVDRFGASRITPVIVAGFALPVLMLALAPPGGGIVLYLYFMTFGLVQGMNHAAGTPLWAELYGTQHLGGIRAIAQSLSVFASALSPVLLGFMIDGGFGLPALALTLGAAPVLSAGLGAIAVHGK